MIATVESKDTLRLLAIEHRAVADLISELSDEEMTRRDTIRYGLYADQECSFKDLLAHLICYEVLTVEAIDAWEKDENHWVIDAVYDARAGRDIHYGGIADRVHLSLREQIDEYRQISAALECAIEQLQESQWRARATFPTMSNTDLGGMIESVMVMPPRPMYRHLPVHIPDCAAFIDSLRHTARSQAAG